LNDLGDNRPVSRLDELVEEMSALMGAPCTLEDPDFRLIGFSGHPDADHLDVVRQHSILRRGSTSEVRSWFLEHGIRESEGPIRTPADPTRGIAGRLCIPARHLGRVHGYFWLLEVQGPLSEDVWPEARRIADFAASLLASVERRQAGRDALYLEVARGLEPPSQQIVSDLAAACGLEGPEPVSCILVDQAGLGERLPGRASRPGVAWARESETLVAGVARSDVVERATSAEELLGSLGLRLSPSLTPTWVGVGPEVQGVGRLRRSRSGAGVALRVARTHARGTVVHWSTLGPLALLGVARDDDLADALLTGQIHDFLNSGAPELVTTARAFLEEAGSASRAASRLGVHRQTVYQRVKEVGRLTGCDLRSGEDRLRLHLALVLARHVATSLPGPAGSRH
jgi:hypothetical protein